MIMFLSVMRSPSSPPNLSFLGSINWLIGTWSTNSYCLPVHLSCSILVTTSTIILLLLRTCPFKYERDSRKFSQANFLGGRHIMFIITIIFWQSGQYPGKNKQEKPITIWFSLDLNSSLFFRWGTSFPICHSSPTMCCVISSLLYSFYLFALPL